jgi:hypothetical protein
MSINPSKQMEDLECKCDSERIHKKTIRRALGVHNKSVIDAIYGETDRFPFHIAKIIRMCKYYNKTLAKQESSLANMALNE